MKLNNEIYLRQIVQRDSNITKVVYWKYLFYEVDGVLHRNENRIDVTYNNPDYAFHCEMDSNAYMFKHTAKKDWEAFIDNFINNQINGAKLVETDKESYIKVFTNTIKNLFLNGKKTKFEEKKEVN